MASKTITVTQGQTLFDLALQYYGDASKAIDIVKANPSITSLLYNGLSGLSITVDQQNNDIVNYYVNNNINIATRYPEITSGGAFSDAFSDAFNN